MMRPATDNGKWHTMFSVCGPDMNPDEVTIRLGFAPDAFIKSGELPVPSVTAGSLREFDTRRSLDVWSAHLSGRQLRQPLDSQLQYWVDRLAAVTPGLRYLRSLGYWTVIDCQVQRQENSPIPCLQFQVPGNIVERIGRLGVDLDVAVFNS